MTTPATDETLQALANTVAGMQATLGAVQAQLGNVLDATVTPQILLGCAVVLMFALGWIAGGQR